MDSKIPFWTSLGAGLPCGLVNPPLDQTVVWDTSIQPPLPLPFISEALPAFPNSLPISFPTGISPNKILACLILSWHLGHEGPEPTGLAHLSLMISISSFYKVLIN